MEDDATLPFKLFRSEMQEALLADLFQMSIEAQCILNSHNHENQHSLSKEKQNDPISLQIVGQYLVERNFETNAIKSILKLDYQHQFQIIRKCSPVKYFRVQVPDKLGEPTGIRFIIRGTDPYERTLFATPERKQDLENFGRILGRKYIVQLGFHTSFKAIKKIGKGMTACVYNALSFATGKEVAIKSFRRSVYFATDNGNGKVRSTDIQISFQKEFKVLTELDHKNICKLVSVYETENSTYVILELLPLSLYGYLQKHGFPSEEQAKNIMINLLEGISYLHEKGIMHRDLKLQNIMVRRDITSSADGNTARVIPVIVDLGLAEYSQNQKYLYTRCGTPGYVAPEVLKIKSTDPVQTYSKVCDIFSLGVIFHILIFKKPLFQGKDVKEVIKKNSDCDINFNADHFALFSELGKDLFKKMLAKDPNERITAKQALSHPYLADPNSSKDSTFVTIQESS